MRGGLPAARLTAALLTVALLLFLDGASKSWAASTLRAHGPRTVAAGLVRLRYHENPGFAFGLGRRPRGLIGYSVAVATALLGLLVYGVLRPRPRGFLVTAGLVAMLAGILGNLRDRVERGYVVDLIDGPGGWPIFNVADVCLAAGMALCLAGLTLATVRARS